MNLQRKVYRDVVIGKLKRLDFGWFLKNGFSYLSMKTERYLKTGFSRAPLAVGLVLTENCNLRCPMCNIPEKYAKNPVEKDTASWKRVIDNLHEIGVGGIALSGGEATIRKDIFELIRHARKFDTAVTLNSNMMLLTDEKLEELVKADPTNINVSVDSGREEISDRLRGGKNVLTRVLDRIQKLASIKKERGLKLTITAVTTLSDLNVDDLDILFEKVSRAKADRLCFIPLHDCAKDDSFLDVSKKAKPDLYDTLRKLSEKYNLPLENSEPYLKSLYKVMTGGRMDVICNAGYVHLVIGSDLTLYRCIPFYNRKTVLYKWDPSKETLKQVWNSTLFRKDRLEALDCDKCFWDCHAEQSFLVRM